MSDVPTRLVRMADYERNRTLFTDDERKVLNANIVGECICPRGVFVSVNPETKHLLTRLEVSP